jgi:hypothetical protein
MGVIRLEARLKSGSEWFATLREYKNEKSVNIALHALRSNDESKFEYRIKENKDG